MSVENSVLKTQRDANTIKKQKCIFADICVHVQNYLLYFIAAVYVS